MPSRKFAYPMLRSHEDRSHGPAVALPDYALCYTIELILTILDREWGAIRVDFAQVRHGPLLSRGNGGTPVKVRSPFAIGRRVGS